MKFASYWDNTKKQALEMEEIEQNLIPGLPDDIALDCLARVPHQFHSGLRPVCHRWRGLLTASSFRRHRVHIGAAEDLIFLVQALLPEATGNIDPNADDSDNSCEQNEDNKSAAASKCHPPSYTLCLYNATFNSWQRITAVPMFAQCVVVDDKLVLVGGWDPTTFDPVTDVRVLDLGTGEWSRGAPMEAPRSFFACAAADGRVYVAGGHDGQKNALRSAEVYDVEADRWSALPAMAEERDECHGVAAGGRFWAVSGYGTDRQGMFDASAECYDPETGEWTKEEEFIAGDGGCCAPSTAFAGVGGNIWSVECGKREVRECTGKEWRAVAAVPEGLVSSPCAAVIGGGERVLVMGSEGSGGVYGASLMDVGSRRWSTVTTPPGFSGFVYSAAALRL